MINELKKIISNTSGNVLAIGLSCQLENILEKNPNIDNYYLLNPLNKNEKLVSKIFSKKIKMNKVKRKFKKKKINNLFVNTIYIMDNYLKFISDSIYIAKDKIYLYGNIDEANLLHKKYKRYTNNIDLKQYEKEALLIIDNTKTKRIYFKNIYYKIYDKIEEGLNLLSEYLVN